MRPTTANTHRAPSRRYPAGRGGAGAASLIESFEPPSLDEGVAEGLVEFVARCRRELPDEAF